LKAFVDSMGHCTFRAATIHIFVAVLIFRAATIHIFVAVLITMSVVVVCLLKSIPGTVSMMVACPVLLKRMVPQDDV